MNANDPDYYEILQLSPEAEQEVIEAAYRRLARKYHPDISKDPGASQRMRLLNEAFEVLGDPATRAAYDRSRAFRRRYEAPMPQQVPDSGRAGPPGPVPSRRPSWLWALPVVAFAVGAVIYFAATSLLIHSEEDNLASSPRESITPRATLAAQPIDARAIFESIEQRASCKTDCDSVGASIFGFGPWEAVDLTGDGQDEVLVTWNQGGNCGYFYEVWGYYQGELTNLTPQTSYLECGFITTEDVLGLGSPQIVVAAKANLDSEPGWDGYSKAIYCWNRAIFVHVATDYEDYDGKPVAPRLAILDPSECR